MSKPAIRLIVLFSVCSVTWLSAQAQPTPGKRLPLPPLGEQQAAFKLASELYRTEYEAAQTPAAKAALAHKILTVAKDTDAPAEGHALLQVARSIAIEAGDARTAFSVAREFSKRFDVDADADRLAIASSLIKTADTAAQQPIVEEMSSIAELAIDDDDYDVADKAASLAMAASTKTKNATLRRDAQRTQREIRRLAAAFTAMKPVRDKLNVAPNDPDARHRWGWFLCAVKGDWESGLPHIAAGDRKALSALATEELGERPNAFSIADRWWEAAEPLKDEERANVRGHAASWYRLALPTLSGINLAKAQSRANLYGHKARILSRLEGHKDMVLDVRFSPTGTLLASTDVAQEGVIKIWNPANGEEVLSWVAHDGGVHSVDFSPDERTLVSSGLNDATIRLWDVDNGRQIRFWKTTGAVVRSVAFSADGSRIISAQYDNGRARIWDPQTGRLLAETPHPSAWAAVFEPHGSFALVAGQNGVYRWNAAVGRVITEYVAGASQARVVSLALHPASSQDIVAGACCDGIYFWRLSRPSQGRVFAAHPSATDATFAPNGKQLISVGLDNAVRVWDVRTGRLLHEFPKVGRMRVDISPAGNVAASANGNTVFLLRLPN
ncbi:MAG: WD40 repeat domain-containing protein [Planctomycetales bacterium]|nr:WD40 repeat domain-containing protein [Planctomycetales bacterium]